MNNKDNVCIKSNFPVYGQNANKRFVVYLLSFIFIFVLLNVTIWKLFTEDLLTTRYAGGDLARMGYLRSMKEFVHKVDDLPIKHMEMKNYSGQHVDVLTIGDSFSNGGGDGKNSYYQDYLASVNNFNVLNVYPFSSEDLVMGFAPFTTLSVLYNSGYLDLIKPEYVLIQSIERYCIPRFATPLRFNHSVKID